MGDFMKTYSNRKSIRLKNYNYKNNGFYFITISTFNKKLLLSNIDNNSNIILSPIGIFIENSINSLNNNSIFIDTYIIMPNHIHFIIQLESSNNSLIDIICNFKRYTSRVINNRYNITLWQSSYYERVIRNDFEYFRFKDYIVNNPYEWNYMKYKWF